jgi:hypothetical protein
MGKFIKNGGKSSEFLKADGSVDSTSYAAASHTHSSHIIKFGGGTTEGTNLFTYNGSTAKTINITAGSNVSFDTSTAGTIKISSSSIATALQGASSQVITDTPSTGQIIYKYNVLTTATGLFDRANNANGILSFNTHSGNYYHQIGLSSNGALYHRYYNNTAINTTLGWAKILTSANYTDYTASKLSSFVAYTSTNTLTTTSNYNTTGLWWGTVYNAGSAAPATYGNVLTIIGGTGGSQLFMGWSGSQTTTATTATGDLYYRSKRDNVNAWTSSWDKILTSKNYSDYAAAKSHTHSSLTLKYGSTPTTAWTYDGSNAKSLTIQAGNSNVTVSGTSDGIIKISAVDTTYTFTASNPTLSWGNAATIGTIGGVTFKVTMPANPNTNTTNTAGSTNKTNSKLLLVGATSTTTGETFTNSGCYIGTDNCLYSNSTKVSVDGHTHSGYASTSHTHNYAGSGSAGGAANSVASNFTLQYNGTSAYTYNGSTARTLNIKAGTNVSVSGDTSGNITITSSYTNTKNTAGSNNTTSKIFLVGATSQADSPQTYSNAGCYAYNGYLYSGSTKVSVEGHTHSYAGSGSAGGAANSVANSLTFKVAGSSYWTYDGSAAKTFGITAGTGISITNSSGVITIANTVTNTDTKTTAGSSNSTSKLYLIGATSQNSSGVTTYSNSTCYASGGYLYSNSKQVLTTVSGQTIGSSSADTSITIGGATLTWDSTNQVLKCNKSIQLTASGLNFISQS